MGSRHSATTLATLTHKLARTLSVLGSCRAGHTRRLVGVGVLWATHLHPPSSVTLIPTEPLARRPLPEISMWLAQFQHSSSGKSALCSQGLRGFVALIVWWLWTVLLA